MAKFKLLGITGAMLQSFLDKFINEDKTTTGEANKLLKLSDLANTVKHILRIRKTATNALDVTNDAGTSFLKVNTQNESVEIGKRIFTTAKDFTLLVATVPGTSTNYFFEISLLYTSGGYPSGWNFSKYLAIVRNGVLQIAYLGGTKDDKGLFTISGTTPNFQLDFTTVSNNYNTTIFVNKLDGGS